MVDSQVVGCALVGEDTLHVQRGVAGLEGSDLGFEVDEELADHCGVEEGGLGRGGCVVFSGSHGE